MDTSVFWASNMFIRPAFLATTTPPPPKKHVTTLVYLPPNMTDAGGELLKRIGTRHAVSTGNIWPCEHGGSVGRVRILVNCRTRYCVPSTQKLL